MNKNIKVIFIDWNGTLSSSKFFGHLENDNFDLFSRIQNTLFNNGKLSHLLDPWMMGKFDSEFVIKHLAKHINESFETLQKEFIKSCKSMVIDQKVLKLVKEIRNKNIKVVIATDNMDSFNRWTVPALDLAKHFDHILNSYDIKARKKNFDETGESLFFGKFINKNNIAPSETMLIDDSEDKNNLIATYGIGYHRVGNCQELQHELKSILALL